MGSLASSRNQQQPNGFDHMSQYAEIVHAQEQYAHHCNNLDHPNEAMSEYARYIHQHTKKQLEKATNSARNRSGTGFSTLSSEGSANSMSSSDS